MIERINGNIVHFNELTLEAVQSLRAERVEVLEEARTDVMVIDDYLGMMAVEGEIGL